MTAIGTTFDIAPASAGLLDRERIIAKPGFNRWLVPPAALCIHLCIGMAYGFSVFWLPLSRSLGVTQTKACPDMTLLQELFTTTCDWRVASMGWMYTLFFVLLGIAAAIWGGWLERAGPRKAGVVSAVCWCGGLVLGAIGVYIHQLWLLWLGSGVIGGIGLGLGYISPVSTLVKWFPDRRGMATGMAIMGFGGGAMIGAPLADLLMNGGAFISAPFADVIAGGAELVGLNPPEHAPGHSHTGLQERDRRRRLADLPHDGRHLLLLHDDRRVPLPTAANRLAPRRLDAACGVECHDLAIQRPSEGRAQDAAVLADLVGALPQRFGWHRRDRHGLADAAGDLRGLPDRLA
jgi:hypothetical protein